MNPVETFLSEGERTRRQRRKLIISIILIVIGLHFLAAIVATVIVVARYIMPPPAEFIVQKDIRLPAKEREHKMNMAAFDALTPKPSFSDKILSARPADFALPDLPKVPLDQMLPLDPAEVVSDQVNSLVGASGVGAGGQGGGGGLGGMGTGFSFLGVQSNGRRILLLFDVSQSVANKAASSGMPLSKIKEETLALIDKLPASSRFGIIQFSQNYKVFRPELVPASDAQRAEVRDWVQNEWVETGTLSGSGVTSNPEGLVGVLKLAAKMQPDVIFIISDGSFQWRPDGNIGNIPWEDIEKAVKALPVDGAEVPIHFIGFQMKPTDKREMGLISRKTGGKLREIK